MDMLNIQMIQDQMKYNQVDRIDNLIHQMKIHQQDMEYIQFYRMMLHDQLDIDHSYMKLEIMQLYQQDIVDMLHLNQRRNQHHKEHKWFLLHLLQNHIHKEYILLLQLLLKWYLQNMLDIGYHHKMLLQVDKHYILF